MVVTTLSLQYMWCVCVYVCVGVLSLSPNTYHTHIPFSHILLSHHTLTPSQVPTVSHHTLLSPNTHTTLTPITLQTHHTHLSPHTILSHHTLTLTTYTHSLPTHTTHTTQPHTPHTPHPLLQHAGYSMNVAPVPLVDEPPGLDAH